MTRQQIAHRAGVSVKTLTNWCRPFRKELEALGLRPGMIVLPPVIVKWIADKFCIDLEAPSVRPFDKLRDRSKAKYALLRPSTPHYALLRKSAL